MIKVTRIKTEKREYYTRFDGAIWTAFFNPINPKTGHPWQAARPVFEGEDCYRRGKYGDQHAPVRMGPAPKHEDNRVEGYDWCYSGYSSEKLALAAIRRHMAKSKLVEIL